MAFWSSWFQKGGGDAEAAPWEEIEYDRDKINFHDTAQRDYFVGGCLEQIDEAERELGILAGEYALVSRVLRDTEEIESLPKGDRQKLSQMAQSLAALERERESYRKKDRKPMPDALYEAMDSMEDSIPEAISRMEETEKYHLLVKKDLKRLDGERSAFAYRREELERLMANMRGLSIIFLGALFLALILLLLLQMGWQMEVHLAYVPVVAVAAAVVLFSSLRFFAAGRELDTLGRDWARLVAVQNKVKIRYVNNVHLLDYLYLKYKTDSSARLKKHWKWYQREKEERRQFLEAGAKSAYYRKQIVELLSKYRIESPAKWLDRLPALLDKREMVEIRHGLVERRQALRKQVEYNQKLARTARRELEGVILQYPAYREELLRACGGRLEEKDP